MWRRLLIYQLGGGYLFGLPVGFVADSLGATIGATAAFLLGRTRTHTDLETDISAKLANVERQFEECSSSLKWSKDRVVEIETKLTFVHEEFCSSKDAAAANEEHLSAEIFTEITETIDAYKEITDNNISNGSLKKKSTVHNMCAGEYSQSFCEICMDEKQREDMFLNNKKCCYSHCTDCISKHVATKIQHNVNSVNCPGLNCKVVLEPEFCRSIVPEQVLDQWVNALCESMILGSQKVYYPFKDCSAMLIDDGVEVVTMSEFPYCQRLFCAQCKIPWHSGLGCDEFKRGIVKDDLLVMEMTRNKNSNCKFYVEKKEGCLHITCRYFYSFISSPLNDLIISQKMASELLKVMGSEESSSVEKSQNVPVINHSTGSAIASILLGLIGSVLFDVNWIIIEL
ncbi:hypothetical protein GIB67_021964, partial [Kingdonia uniflora]